MLIFLVIISFVYAFCNGHLLYEFDVKGEAEFGYFFSVDIGTPSQHLNLLLDTGSSNFAVSCAPLSKGDSRYFKYNNSLTFRSLSTEIELHYVTGCWKGFLAEDILNICESNCSVLSNIGCMLSGQEIFEEHSQFQGVFGLAYSSLAKPDSSVLPFIDIFTKSQNISNIFALLLCGPYFSSVEQVTNCGKFHIGSYSPKSFYGDILYTPVVQEWFYEVVLTDIKVDVTQMPEACTNLNKGRSIVDSGTTGLNFPINVYNWVIERMRKYVKHIFPNQFWLNQTVECVSDNFNVSMFPTLTISFFHTRSSFFDINISPELYILPIHGMQKTCFKMGIGVSNYGTVIGAAVLKGFYVIFDKENKKIGFANSSALRGMLQFTTKVSGPNDSIEDLNKCKEKILDKSDISVLTIVLLCAVVVCALFYYTL